MSVLQRVFGFDFFISHAWVDGQEYAANLTESLQKSTKRFRCFLDVRNLHAGDRLDQGIRSGLQASTVLILVATPGALGRRYVIDEVRTFNKLDRPVVVIDVNRTVTLNPRAELAQLVSDRLRVDETATTTPSPEVVEKIVIAFRATRRRTRLIQLLTAATATFAVLALAALGLFLWADHERGRAETATQTADRRRVEAENATKQANQRLRESLRQGARAARQSLQFDRRTEALRALAEAARLQPGTDLRLEYVRCLDLPSVRPGWELGELDDRTSSQLVPDRLLDGVDADRRQRYRRAIWLNALSDFMPDGRRVRLVPRPGCLAQIGAETGLVDVSGDPKWAGSPLAMESAAGYLIVGRKEGAELWDLNADKPLGVLKSKTGEAVEPAVVAFGAQSRLAVVHIRAGKGGEPQEPGNFQKLPLRLIVYECPSLRVQSEWEFEGAPIDRLALHPAGDLVALSTSGGTGFAHVIRLWQPSSGRELPGIVVSQLDQPRLFNAPFLMEFSPNGHFLAAASSDGTIRLWSFALPRFGPGILPKESLRIVAHEGGLASGAGAIAVRFSPNGRWLLTTGGDALLKLWEVDTGRLVAQQRLGDPTRFQVTSLSWSPSGDAILCGTAAGLRVWRFDPPLPKAYSAADTRGQRGGRASIRFDPRERWLAYETGNSGILVDLTDPNAAPIVLDTAGIGHQYVWSADGSRLYGCGHLGECLEWSPPSPIGVTVRRGDLTGLTDLRGAAYRDGTGLVGAEDQVGFRLTILDAGTGECRWTTELPWIAPERVDLFFSGGGTEVALTRPVGDQASQRFRITAWDTRASQPRPLGNWEFWSASSGNAFPRGERLLAIVNPSALAVVDVRRQEIDFVGQPGAAAADLFREPGVMVCADGTVCAQFEPGGTVRFWSLTNRPAKPGAEPAPVASIPGGMLADPQLTAEGAYFAAADRDGLKVWRVEGGELVGTLPGRWQRYRLFTGAGGRPAVVLMRDGGEVVRWEVGKAAPRPVGRLAGWDAVRADRDWLHISEDGSRLTVGSAGPRAREDLTGVTAPLRLTTWALTDGAVPTSFEAPFRGEISRWAFSADGKSIAVLTRTSQSRVGPMNGPAYLTFDQGEAGQRWTYLSPDGRAAAVRKAGEGNRYRLDVWALDPTGRLGGLDLEHDPWPVRVGDGAARLAVGQGDRVVVYDGRRGPSRTVEVRSPSGVITHLAMSSSGVLGTRSEGERAVLLWDGRTGSLLAELPADLPSEVDEVEISSHGRWAAITDSVGRLRLWDLHELRRRLREAGLDWDDSTDRAAITDSVGRLRLRDLHELRRRLRDATFSWGDSTGRAGLPAADPEQVVLHRSAVRLGQAGRYQAAEEQLTAALGLGGARSGILLRDRGRVRLFLGRRDDAIDDLLDARQRGVRIDSAGFSGLSDVLEGRGHERAKAGRWAEAAADFKSASEALTDSGDDATVGQLRLKHLGVYRALACLARNDPAGYRAASADVLAQAGQSPTSDDVLHAADLCALSPESRVDWGRLIRLVEIASLSGRFSRPDLKGILLLRSGRVGDAIAELEAVGSNPHLREWREAHPEYWLYLASAYGRADRKPDARAAVEKAEKAAAKVAKQPVLNPDVVWIRPVRLRALRDEVGDGNKP